MRARQLRLPLLIALIVGSSLWLLSPSGHAAPRLAAQRWLAGSRPSGRCNPFDAPGWLHIDFELASGTRWQTFDEAACPSSHLIADFWSGLNGNETMLASLEWARGRTVVKSGDSVDREQLFRESLTSRRC